MITRSKNSNGKSATKFKHIFFIHKTNKSIVYNTVFKN